MATTRTAQLVVWRTSNKSYGFMKKTFDFSGCLIEDGRVVFVHSGQYQFEDDVKAATRYAWGRVQQNNRDVKLAHLLLDGDEPPENRGK